MYRGITRGTRRRIANDLDSVLTDFEEYVEDQQQDENENLLLDSRAVSDHIGALQDILRKLDREEQLIK